MSQSSFAGLYWFELVRWSLLVKQFSHYCQASDYNNIWMFYKVLYIYMM